MDGDDVGVFQGGDGVGFRICCRKLSSLAGDVGLEDFQGFPARQSSKGAR